MISCLRVYDRIWIGIKCVIRVHSECLVCENSGKDAHICPADTSVRRSKLMSENTEHGICMQANSLHNWKGRRGEERRWTVMQFRLSPAPLRRRLQVSQAPSKVELQRRFARKPYDLHTCVCVPTDGATIHDGFTEYYLMIHEQHETTLAVADLIAPVCFIPWWSLVHPLKVLFIAFHCLGCHFTLWWLSQIRNWRFVFFFRKWNNNVSHIRTSLGR